jgi:peptide/nickel transport system permease protein
MNRYLVRRLLIAIPTLLIMSAVIYAILALAPGDPLSQFALNPAVPAEVRERLRHAMGLDDPWYVRYFKWLTAMLQGDFGWSFASHVPVIDLIKQRLPNTLAVLGIAYIVSILIAIPIGILSAVKRYTWFDHIATTFAFVGYSIPTFFAGIVLIIVFAIKLRWLPFIYDSTLQVHDLDTLGMQLKQSIMPITVLALFETATLTRFVRSEMLENLSLDYVRTARSKGLTEPTVITKHALRNSLIPVVTLIALGVPTIFTGAIITEQIFAVPGIGQLLISSIEINDLPVIMGITFIYAILVVIFNLIADLLYAVLDPRIKYT